MGIFNFSKNERSEEPVTEQPQAHNDWQENRPTGEQNNVDEIFSVPVKAGKRIYYFDVKTTRADDYYITITESRKKTSRDGSFTIDKHKIHLYKEDFAKFSEGFNQVIEYVKTQKPDFFEQIEQDPNL